MTLNEILQDEKRRQEFPVVSAGVFLAHAGVSPLPAAAKRALNEFSEKGSVANQENDWAMAQVANARKKSAQLLGCSSDEIALLGPTALGLNLVANGLPWKEGDEVLFYMDDYPANVYPWLNLANRGVKPIALKPERLGEITWSFIEKSLTPRTRLVALATSNFISGYRIDVDHIGKKLHERNILFSLDGIQTLGAFPLSVEQVDFLSADSHKWMLGPVGAGIFYVKKAHHDFLKPTLLGSWNVVSPKFVAQEKINFYEGARRYEPGTLNVPGILGMAASLDLLLGVGIENISTRILHLRKYLLERLVSLGFQDLLDRDAPRSGILSVLHPTQDLRRAFQKLADEKITASLRFTRAGQAVLRFSPHFYNTEEELTAISELLSLP